jgi:hypothetical protein
MSTISQTPKVSTVHILNNRNLNFFVAAALVATVVVIFASIVRSPAAKPMDHSAYMTYRQGEWASIPISNQTAYQIFRGGEVASPLSITEAYQTFRKGEVVSVPNVTNAEAYQLFRLGEWASVNIPAIDLSAYRLSERTLTDPNAGLEMFLQSERTLTDPQAGMAIYFNSERTLVPAPFTQFQLSEWFGQ